MPATLRVIVLWWFELPPGPALQQLAEATGTVPALTRLGPWYFALAQRGPAGSRAAHAFFRVARSTQARLFRLAQQLVRRRGGTRPARLVLQVSGQRPRAAVTSARIARRVQEAMPGPGVPLLLVVTDTRAAAAARAACADRPDSIVVLGVDAAIRVLSALRTSQTAWRNWADVTGDTDPDHLYAALPTPSGDPAPTVHELRAATPVTAPSAPRPQSAPHLLIAPANYAGQGAAWALAAERVLGVRAENLHVVRADAPFQFAADHPVTSAEWSSPGVRRRIAAEAVAASSHVLLESLRPIIDVAGMARSAWDFSAGAADARELVQTGRRVGLLLHGSESRSPERHAELYPVSPFREALGTAPVQRLTDATRTVHDLLDQLSADLGLARFVSTPDMLDFVPGSIWLPVVVRRDAVTPASPILRSPRPVVLHAPSNPLLKGSDVVDAAMARLDRQGLISYRRLTGVPPALVADHVRAADIVIDQISLGNLGVMALEAMGAGRLVMAHITDRVVARYSEPVPVVAVNPTDLVDRVMHVVEQPDDFRALAAQGPDFVRRHHDGNRSAAVIAQFLGNAPG